MKINGESTRARNVTVKSLGCITAVTVCVCCTPRCRNASGVVPVKNAGVAAAIVERDCGRCGRAFVVPFALRGTRYCDDCRPTVAAERKSRQNRRAYGRRKRRAAS